MSKTYTLAANPRTVTGKKVGQIRRQGLVPAVIYGAKVQPTHLQIAYRDLETTLLKAGGTHLIDVNVDGAVQTVLARSVQRDVLKGTIIHVDFLAIDKSTKITTEVPLHFVGESPAVAARMGVVQSDMQTIEIEALPMDLIDGVNVDVSGLTEVGSVVHVRELVLPSGVTARADADAVVVRIVPLRIISDIEETSSEEGASEPELVERKRGEDFED
ncbi:MAG: 50S ribosomal protein L25 [Anaerolineae bacterium]|nr:50S ribosomal protein L25 [Anaerolineae bacterium]NUQ04260.1 50S ribosomal protein L25 [Anaerolineae bacterium]